MRSTIILSTLAALAVANPLPQQIDFAAIDALPEASVSAAPVDVASQSVSVKPSAAVTSIAAAKVTATTLPSGAAVKRELTNRAACDPQPSGKAPNSKCVYASLQQPIEAFTNTSIAQIPPMLF